MMLRINLALPVEARRSIRPLCRPLRYVFFAIGFVALAWVGFAYFDAELYQAGQSRLFEKILQVSSKTPSGAGSQPLTGSVAEADRSRAIGPQTAARSGYPLGRIEIGSIGMQAMVFEGTDARTLRRAVGHIPGTALPGESGNVAIAGHRDTFFRALEKIRKNDEITLATLNGFYRYRVDVTRVVEPDDIAVLGDEGGSVLTLVTCYPFGLIGPAPQRFVVRARLSGE